MIRDTSSRSTSQWHVLVAAVAAAIIVASAAVAQSTLPSLVLTATPDVVNKGETVEVVMVATNTSGRALDASKFPAFGVRIPTQLQGNIRVLEKPGQCRWSTVNSNRLYYCGWPKPAANGSSAVIRLSIAPSVSGSFQLSAYARYGMSENDANATASLLVQ